MSTTVVIERNVPVPMRDGTILRADVYRPPVDHPVPAILCRIPYDISHALVPLSGLDPERAAEVGLAYVCETTRGRYGSKGRFYPFVHERADGYDSVEWVAAQPWCSGAVGMAGRSYGGCTQWLAAIEQPPHLKAIFPVVIGSQFYENWIYQGGAFHLGFNLYWALLMTNPREANNANRHCEHLPLSTVPVLRENEAASFYFDWLEHATEDDYWQRISIHRHYPQVQVPAYNVGAWYDLFLPGTLENFTRMRAEGGSEAARRGQRLLVGPWGHGSTYGTFPDHSFPQFAPTDAVDLTEIALRFFARHLNGERNGLDEEPPVRLFVMGENRWRDEHEWPLARTRFTPWYLRSGFGAESPDGRLLPVPPGEESPDQYLYDPRDPAPTIGGITSLPGLLFGTSSGPKDQRRLEARADVAVYTSDPLQQPLEVTGPLEVVLYAATDVPDTDWVAKLMDVQPDGASLILAEGILRARFRSGLETPGALQSGKVYAFRISAGATSNLFRPGHRIRVAITSSSFPRFDRNPNTGRPPGADGPEALRAAHQTIFHDARRPSHIILPIVTT